VTGDRLTHLGEVGALLWPAPLTVDHGAGPAPEGTTVHREFLLLPDRRRPRLLVPPGRAPAAAAVRRYGEGRGRLARWGAVGLSVAGRLGVAQVLLRDRVRVHLPAAATAAGIEEHLAAVLGRDVLVSMHLGPPRANRKPVLQLLSPDGETFAFVKVGIDPLTCRLVRAEGAALDTLAAAGLTAITAPRALHRGQWRGLELLVQSALPVWQRRRPLTAELVQRAQREVAAIGSTPAGALTASTYWMQLTDRVAALPPSPAAGELGALLPALARATGDVEVALGAWHGDWTPWNSAAVGGTLMVWDWERFDTGVPAGFDAVHLELQTDLVNRLADPRASAERCLATAAAVLAPLGLSARQAEVTAMTYLAELATRYLGDRQSEAGARLGDVGAWLLPALRARLEEEPC
jgi:hypothetical protein